jgi:Raf kinase inhibitor-like YbhB/YbcL family protein
MRAGLLLMLLAALAACGSSEGSKAETSEATPVVVPQASPSITLSSSDFAEGGTLSLGQVYSGFGCVGSNRSPQLSWTAVPGAQSYVVTLFDPDAPGDGWWHWTVANIPASVTSLAAGAGGRRGVLPGGTVQGRTDFDTVGYGGPCPPVGDEPHRYVFTVYAIGLESLAVDSGTDGKAFKAAVDQAAIATGTITARFGR